MKRQGHKPEESDAVMAAVEGEPPDVQIVRARPGTMSEIQECGRDMIKSLFVQGCEYYRVIPEPGRIVAEGWRQTPRRAAAYVPPPPVAKRSGFAMDLRPADRERLRHIVRRTHTWTWREPPTTAMVDELIDAWGPEVAGNTVKEARDRRLVA